MEQHAAPKRKECEKAYNCWGHGFTKFIDGHCDAILFDNTISEISRDTKDWSPACTRAVHVCFKLAEEFESLIQELFLISFFFPLSLQLCLVACIEVIKYFLVQVFWGSCCPFQWENNTLSTNTSPGIIGINTITIDCLSFPM